MKERGTEMEVSENKHSERKEKEIRKTELIRGDKGER